MRKKYFLLNSYVAAFIAFVFLFIVGCNKSIPKYYHIKYEANGIQQIDTTATLAILYANDTLPSYGANLSARNSSTTSIINIVIYSKTPFNTTTVYEDTARSLGTTIAIEYYTSSYTFPNYPKLSSIYLVPNKVIVHFNNISATSIEGTFSGNISASDTSAITSITNGEFYLRVH